MHSQICFELKQETCRPIKLCSCFSTAIWWPDSSEVFLVYAAPLVDLSCCDLTTPSWSWSPSWWCFSGQNSDQALRIPILSRNWCAKITIYVNSTLRSNNPRQYCLIGNCTDHVGQIWSYSMPKREGRWTLTSNHGFRQTNVRHDSHSANE